MTSAVMSGRDSRHPQGAAMVLMGGLCLSFGGLILRHIETADGWQIMFYRSLAFAATLLIYVVFRYRGGTLDAFRRVGRDGLIAALLMGAGATGYLFSLILNTVAEAMFLLSTAPLFTAILAWIVLGERVGRATSIAIAGAVLGIGVMFADGILGSGSGNWLGRAVALIAPLTFAGMIVVWRRSKTVDMVPATCLGGAAAAVTAFIMAGDLAVGTHDLTLSLLLGTVQIGAGFLLITIGTRYVPAAEVALLSLTEVVMGPLWVWWFINEVPSGHTLAGGLIVLTAVAGLALYGLRRSGRAPTA